MEIYRNDPMVRVTLTGMYDRITKITIAKSSMRTTYSIGEGAPSGDFDLTRDSMWVDSTTGDIYSPDGVLESKFEYGTIAVPYKYVHFCGKFQVWWDYIVDGEEFTETSQYDVVQPLFTYESLVSFDEDFKSITESASKRLERTVRAVIEQITGQKFEITNETVVARSYNGSTLVLPKRLISLETPGTVSSVRVDVESDGWIIRSRQYSADANKWYTNPVQDENSFSVFTNDRFRINGVFGYNTVPEEIELAAMLLAQDYGCRESLWRDRYITNMKNADWRVEYDDRAFVGTGNAKVDLILQKYTVNKMVVI